MGEWREQINEPNTFTQFSKSENINNKVIYKSLYLDKVLLLIKDYHLTPWHYPFQQGCRTHNNTSDNTEYNKQITTLNNKKHTELLFISLLNSKKNSFNLIR